jgi:mannose-6-phosphate isomerase-like protein (cupin superfamily)
VIRIMTLEDGEAVGLENGRGRKVRLVDSRLGTDAIDLHHNTLFPGGPAGRYHRHSKADNVYIVTSGVGQLVADGVSHTVSKGQIIFIPAGVPHALSNPGDEPFGIFEIYAPAGPDFDFIVLDP